ncbi:hypothetical protein NliqN6_0495 [Naganishia liquefaciens]|uniref:MFS transporter n=1 Tax=Naganishia liquefaciens TaxID=104408 RepID=A0A8H3TNM0_9TREE|nr:hypothetical protein NliqN6_0495 [Naganishia liquefaciens]
MATAPAPAYADTEAKPTVESLEHVRTNEKADITSSLQDAAPSPQALAYDLQASKRLARKMDIHNVPIVALCYLFAFIDRTNIGNARLAGIEKDLKLVGYDYNTLLSIFYVSYIVFELPANLFTKWFGPGKAIPLYTIIFGVLSIAMAFVKNFGASLAVRFLLGAAEAGMLPGIAYYLGRWYTKDELGIITTVIGIAAYILLTDRPETARWLSPEEKQLAELRVRSENVGATVAIEKFSWKRVKQGISAPSTIILAFIFGFNNVTVQGVAFFTPTIIRGIYPGRTTVQQQLLTVPAYIVGACFVLGVPYMASRLRRRGIFLVAATPLVAAGYIIFLATTKPQPRYAGVFLINCGAFVFGPIVTAWTQINVASDTARASALGLVVMLGNCGGLISTWSYLPSDGPNYPIGNGINLGCTGAIFILLVLLLFFMRVDNKKRDRGDYDHYLETTSSPELLGNNHPEFRWRP